MATIYTDADIDRSLILGEQVAVLGYGSQGHAHAQNLRDSGVSVQVAVRPGPSHDAAKRDGFEPTTIASAVREASAVVFCLPDGATPQVYDAEVKPNLNPGQMLIFCHGYHVRFSNFNFPESVDVVMVAPSGPGASLRQLYCENLGMPCLVAVQQDATNQAWDRALSYASALGCGRAGIVKSTFEEEAETDLFGEQAVLVGGLMGLVQAGFDTLIRQGYQPEVAYFECLHQVKMLAELMQRGGIAGMLASISDTAHWGAHQAAGRVIGEASRQAMDALLGEIRDGTFAAKWAAENAAGCRELDRLWRDSAETELQKTGERLRKNMPYLNPIDAKVAERRNRPASR